MTGGGLRYQEALAQRKSAIPGIFLPCRVWEQNAYQSATLRESRFFAHWRRPMLPQRHHKKA